MSLGILGWGALISGSAIKVSNGGTTQACNQCILDECV